MIFSGNNSQLVKKIIERRSWWIEQPAINNMYSLVANFRWQPFSNGFRFESLNGNNTTRQMFNHVEFHEELSKKANLYQNMLQFSELTKENVFNILPITFTFEIHSDKILAALPRLLQSFIIIFNTLKEESKKLDLYKNVLENQTFYKSSSRMVSAKEKFRKNSLLLSGSIHGILQYSKYTMPVSHFVGHNLWLLKPSGLNRGRGIHIFDNLDSMRNAILEDCTDKKGEYPSFVIQKYIEKPLLINGRKFDIRVWVLLTHLHEFYLFKEGYIRTSCMKYEINSENITDKYIHLTNNAIQKDSINYGQYEEGNQISFTNFKNYIQGVEKNGNLINFENDILDNIKNTIKKSMYSAKKKIDPEYRKYSFEIFGYDFIIDEDYNVWLIEINTNPCLEESSSLLKSLIPRMLDDAFKLTLDQIFPNPGNEKMYAYPIIGYEDSQNLWYFYNCYKI